MKVGNTGYFASLIFQGRRYLVPSGQELGVQASTSNGGCLITPRWGESLSFPHSFCSSGCGLGPLRWCLAGAEQILSKYAFFVLLDFSFPGSFGRGFVSLPTGISRILTALAPSLEYMRQKEK